jgi:VIT1/CCC1 family predicted Fe2+/Mn2+ transporter
MSLGAVIVSLPVIGIALAIAGVIITILERNQINRMKQFADISDHISLI